MKFEDLFGLKDEVAIVTGGGAGIGRAICRLFAKAGASVIVSDLDTEAAYKVADEIKANGDKAFGKSCDVTKEEELANLVDETIEKFGKITILVNNVGGGGPKPFDMPMDDFIWAYKLNVFSGFRLSQLCVPYMEKIRHGSILNISSMAAENINVNMTSYSSSKAAVNHLTRNMAFELGPKGIRVNAVAPGAIMTQALETVLTPEIENNMLKKTPLGRLGYPDDIAQAALFLCSPAASWISGQILTVSGGGTQELD
ncbi:7-alpha-hydroxysteroid dehydrogenase [Methanosarcina sp. UBA411]|jgi:7-alpha-hydroxysteroid dehydrogenase|uniref:7-alpha-hydroxysteroid dehydrogenase n=1 Tax=Methanosarcina sp. UBA411 TaxID=1915589 RepID=UPI0025FCA8AF|nr:7-alpha-hydroxysteroid dehydrogenase [Methanosarcina sp. UBA411]